MIRRIYIDNYKCFSNFEWYPDSMQLLLGKNGSGKTTVFDVLESLREFIVNSLPAPYAFPTDSLTKWDNKTEQRFELDIEGNGGLYKYKLTIEHDLKAHKCLIVDESIFFDEEPLYGFTDGELFYLRDGKDRGPTMSFERSRSPLSTIPEREDYQRLTWFRDRIQRIYIFSPDPLRMKALSTEEVSNCDREMHQLASWLRHLVQESHSTIANIEDSLKEVIDNLELFMLKKVSDAAYTLTFNFKYEQQENSSAGNGTPTSLDVKPISFTLDQLSTGQKCLIALFTIVHAVVRKDYTVCIDEPDNFIALREIQPWLIQLEEHVEDNESQCFLISHHPELINYLAAENSGLFYREENGPARTKIVKWKENGLLLPAEIIAREWE